MIGNAGKKIQNIVDLAEELYEKVNQLRDQIADLGETVEDTNERVSAIESELAEQRALLEAVADADGVDVDEVLAEPDPVDSDGEDGADEATETATPDQD